MGLFNLFKTKSRPRCWATVHNVIPCYFQSYIVYIKINGNIYYRKFSNHYDRPFCKGEKIFIDLKGWKQL